MAAIITSKFRLNNAEQFVESFSETAATAYYLFIGRSSTWQTDNLSALGCFSQALIKPTTTPSALAERSSIDSTSNPAIERLSERFSIDFGKSTRSFSQEIGTRMGRFYYPLELRKQLAFLKGEGFLVEF